MSPARVILIVDRTFSSRVRELPEDTPAWIVDSSENHPAIVVHMEEAKSSRRVGRLTWFRDVPDLSPADLAASIIDTIDEHHGVHSQKPAFSHLTVIGAKESPSLTASLRELGFRLISARDSSLEYAKKTG